MSYSNPFSTFLFNLIYPDRPSSTRCTTAYCGWLLVHKQCDRVGLTSPSSTEDECLDVSCLYVSMCHRFIKHLLGFFTRCVVRKYLICFIHGKTKFFTQVLPAMLHLLHHLHEVVSDEGGVCWVGRQHGGDMVYYSTKTSHGSPVS